MREKIFKNQPRRVVYIYSEKSHFVEELYQEKLIDKAIRQLPTTYEKLEEIVAPFVKEGVILIVDDGLSQLHGYLPKIFEEFTSKNNCSVFFVSQSIFVEDKNFIRLSNNCHYIVFMANRRNTARIRALAQQVKPCNQALLIIASLMPLKKNVLQAPPPKSTVLATLFWSLTCNPLKFLCVELTYFPMRSNQSLSM